MRKQEAIYAMYPSVISIRGDDAFDADGNPVTYDETAVQAYIDAHAYIAKRQAEYPSIVDQLDTLYHGGIDAWKAKIKTVKDKYPKS